MTQQIKGPLKEIHFVTGKGGVGKSTYAALLAKQFASQGKKTLLVEIGERSFYSYFFEQKMTYTPQKLAQNLEVAHWSAAECLKSYVLSLVKVEALYRLFFENPISQSLIQVAPGLTELALLGQITSAPRNHGPHGDHEILVIDAFATGHFLNLVKAAEAMKETIPRGPMGEQSRKIDDVMHTPGLIHTHIVALSEELVLTESLELYKSLKKEFPWEFHFVLNRFLETNLKSKDLDEDSKNLAIQVVHNKLFQQEETQKKLKATGTELISIPLVKNMQNFEDLKAIL